MLYKISIIMGDNSSGYKENFETENKKCTQNNSEISFTKKMLCNYYFEKKQNVKIIINKMVPLNSNYKMKIIERLTVLSSLITSKNSIYERQINDKIEDPEIICIKLERENTNTDKNKSLFEYFKSGVKLSCFLSLDFSENKNNPSLIHTKINYLNIFKYISSNLANYTKNHLFYLSGFNGKIQSSQSNKTVFNLNMNEKDSSVNTIDKVNYYFNICLEKNLVKPENNNYLSPIIKQITNEIYKLYEIRYYNVSFIITRGVIEQKDIKKTIDAIIESSYLPLTIIIICVGKNDYSQMRNTFPLKQKFSSLGMEKMRDNILITSLIDDFSNNAEKLISWCLEELSKQIINYYDLIRSSPDHIYHNNLKNIEESFNLYNSSICLERSEIVNESDLQIRNEEKAPLALDKSTSPFFDNKFNSNKPNDEIKEENINKNIMIKENPYKSDVNVSNLSQSNKSNINIDDETISKELSKKTFVNEKPNIYESVIDNNNKKTNKDININNTNNNNGNCNLIYTPTPTDSVNPDIKDNPYNGNCNMICTPTPTNSINPDIKDNPYNENNFKTPDAPGPNTYQNQKYNIPNKSILVNNQNDKNYNPYADDFKKQNLGNIKQSNNSMGLKKMNNISEASEINSTKNSENIKCSNYFLFNNYSIDSSHIK